MGQFLRLTGSHGGSPFKVKIVLASDSFVLYSEIFKIWILKNNPSVFQSCGK